MSRFEFWLGQQTKLIELGAVTSTIVLEGPDGSPWGTWPAQFAELEQSIEGIVVGLSRELPKGKHLAKLIAYDSTKAQLSVFPFTIVGASDAATEGAQQQLGTQRANAIMISNFEKQFEGMSRALDRMVAHAQAQDIGYSKLLSAFERIEEVSIDKRLEVTREQGKQERLNKIVDNVGPLLELGMGLIGEYMSKRAPETPPAPPVPPVQPPELPPEPAVTAVQAVAEVAQLTNGKAASDEPTVACDPRSDSQPLEPGPDGQGRSKRVRGSSDLRARPKNSKSTRKTKRAAA